MAYNKSIDSSAINTDLTSIANAIRAKSGGSGQLAFPAGFVSEINNIPSASNVCELVKAGMVISNNGTTYTGDTPTLPRAAAANDIYFPVNAGTAFTQVLKYGGTLASATARSVLSWSQGTRPKIYRTTIYLESSVGATILVPTIYEGQINKSITVDLYVIHAGDL